MILCFAEETVDLSEKSVDNFIPICSQLKIEPLFKLPRARRLSSTFDRFKCKDHIFLFQKLLFQLTLSFSSQCSFSTSISSQNRPFRNVRIPSSRLPAESDHRLRRVLVRLRLRGSPDHAPLSPTIVHIPRMCTNAERISVAV
jgi:hypothetical protein